MNYKTVRKGVATVRNLRRRKLEIAGAYFGILISFSSFLVVIYFLIVDLSTDTSHEDEGIETTIAYVLIGITGALILLLRIELNSLFFQINILYYITYIKPLSRSIHCSGFIIVRSNAEKSRRRRRNSIRNRFISITFLIYKKII